MEDLSKYPVVVRFKSVGGILVAEQPWPRAFLVSPYVLKEDVVELRPLTLRTVLVVLGQNWISQGIWRVRRALWRAGFLDAHEARPFSEATWRWRFWLPRRGTDPRAAARGADQQGV